MEYIGGYNNIKLSKPFLWNGLFNIKGIKFNKLIFLTPFMGGLLFDMTGDYNVSFMAAMAAGSTNLVVLALFGLRIRRQSSAASQANVSGSA